MTFGQRFFSKRHRRFTIDWRHRWPRYGHRVLKIREYSSSRVNTINKHEGVSFMEYYGTIISIWQWQMYITVCTFQVKVAWSHWQSCISVSDVSPCVGPLPGKVVLNKPHKSVVLVRRLHRLVSPKIWYSFHRRPSVPSGTDFSDFRSRDIFGISGQCSKHRIVIMPLYWSMDLKLQKIILDNSRHVSGRLDIGCMTIFAECRFSSSKSTF